MFVKTDRCVQLIEPIVTEHTLEVLDIIIVDVGWPVSQFYITAVTIVVEFERAEALASIWIIYEIADVRPPPLRTEIDQAFEKRRVTHVIEIDGLQDILDRMIARTNFRALNSVADFELRNRNSARNCAV